MGFVLFFISTWSLHLGKKKELEQRMESKPNLRSEPSTRDLDLQQNSRTGVTFTLLTGLSETFSLSLRFQMPQHRLK